MTAQRLTLTGWLAVTYAVLGLPLFFALAAFLRSQPGEFRPTASWPSKSRVS
jgi:hypothetical protein